MNLDIAKRFAKQGYYVFPFFVGRNGVKIKPYGWALNDTQDEVKKQKAIPATTLEMEIDNWNDKLQKHYNSAPTCFGVLGKGIVILDLDLKKGKKGDEQYDLLKEKFKIPSCELIVKTQSGGYHLYFKRPAKFRNAHVKSLVDLFIMGHKYEGVDIRGDGGFVQGPMSIGASEWKEGEYTIIKGSPESELSEIPEAFIQYVAGSSASSDLDSMMAFEVAETKDDDLLSVLRRGELPETVPDGQRNAAFFTFVNALKSKGLDREIAKVMCYELAKRCENVETLALSVDIDDMLNRAFEKSMDNPYDIGLDLVARGLHMVTSHGARIKYCILEPNPYIQSTAMHDLSSMKEIMSRYARNVTGPDGKSKLVNPMDVAIKRIPPGQMVDTIGFKPEPCTVFQMNFESGKRFLNTYNPITIPQEPQSRRAILEFQILIERMFGPRDSEDYVMGLDFIAWLIQHPSVKPAISLYLISETRGAGKSMFLNLLTHIFGVSKTGDRQAKVRRLDSLTGRFFNPTGCVLNIIDEVQFSVHKNTRQETADFWRVLKNLITANTVEVEIKGGEHYNLLNTAGLIMAGNTGSRFPIEEYDRRLWIVDSQAPKMEPGTVDLLYAIADNTDAFSDTEKIDGVESIRWFLSKHKIVNNMTTIVAPMTAIKDEMYRASMADDEEWLLEYFEDPTNMLAQTEVISKEAFMYIIKSHPDVPVEGWRDNSARLFRDAVRRGHLKAYKRPSGAMFQFQDMLGVNALGEVYRTGKATGLYVVRNYENVLKSDSNTVYNKYKMNLATIAKFKTDLANRKKAVSASEYTDLKVVE